MSMTDENNKPNGWKEWGNHILQTLSRLENKMVNIEKQQHNFELDYQKEITRLKTKSAIWGAVTGIIGSLVVSVVVGIVVSLSANYMIGEMETQINSKHYNSTSSIFLNKQKPKLDYYKSKKEV